MTKEAEKQVSKTDPLGEVVVELRGLYGQLEEVSKQQRGLIEREQIDLLVDLLGERAVLVEQIDRRSRRVAELTDSTSGGPGGDLESIRDQLAELGRMAQSVADRDDADRGLLEACKDIVGDDLAGMAKNKAAVNAYGAGESVPHQPRFQDREA